MITITDIEAPVFQRSTLIALTNSKELLERGKNTPPKYCYSGLTDSIDAKELFAKYAVPTVSSNKEVNTQDFSFFSQGDFILLANEMFQGTSPLSGEAYAALTEVWLKNLKNTSTIEGML